MRHYEKTVHSPQRLTKPLVRIGEKGKGEFAPISWPEAIKYICSQWQQLIATCGPESILPYSYAGTMGLVQRNAGHAFFYTIGASRLDRTICSAAKSAGWNMVMGATPAMQPGEIEKSDLVILWGINAAATSIHGLQNALAARKNGAKIVVIDTYHTPTAEIADEVLLVKPGSDGALALAIMHILVRDEHINRDFIAENVLGFEELAQKILPECSPDKMAARCGLEVGQIEALAQQYGNARAPFIRLGSGLSRYGNGGMTVRTITCLPALTGAWQEEGGGIFLGTSTGAAFPTHLVTREDLSPPSSRLINMNQLGDALNTLVDPPIRSLYVYHSNPASIAPDQSAVLQGLMRGDLFTVVHERFLTDTACYADIVLPATTSLEHDDLYRSYGSYAAQAGYAAIPPVGEAKSNWEVFALLAQGMGLTDPFFSQSAQDLLGQLLAEENSWHDHEQASALRTGAPILLTPPDNGKQRWQTPSGKIEILNTREAEPLPRVLPTHAEEDGLPLRLQSAPSRYALNSSFYEQKDLREKQQCMHLLMHPVDARDRNLFDGQRVEVRNRLGRVQLKLKISEHTKAGTVVSEGVWWRQFLPGTSGINTLMEQRLTDRGRGSTLYDVAVEVQGI
jgi:anaerobic selenocysteine-containing dehydrogenase